MNPLEIYQNLPDEELLCRIDRVRQKWGKKLLILVHYYQKPEIIRLADAVGDSFALSAAAARRQDCEVILFCGVRFMAETADILAQAPGREKKPIVLSPAPHAGCLMASMADGLELQGTWEILESVLGKDSITPVTYVNSSAEVKAFCGKNGGYACTSSNARKVLARALSERDRVLFLPDQQLGRNTALELGIPEEKICLWASANPIVHDELRRLEREGFPLPTSARCKITREELIRSKVILWDGYCPVHQRFTLDQIQQLRAENPRIQILVHPECAQSVVSAADAAGSTKKILDLVQGGSDGDIWGIGTERRMVEALAQDFPMQTILPLSSEKPLCSTMDEVSLSSICQTLESMDEGTILNQVSVPESIASDARLALERMLSCQ